MTRTIDNLFRRGARVVYSALERGVHVSGHAGRDELRRMIELLRPRYAVPIHGEYRHMVLYRELCGEAGIPPERVLLPEIGGVLEFTANSGAHKGRVPSGNILVDRLGDRGEGQVTLRDREHLADDGVVVVTIVVDRETGELIAGPDLVAKGLRPELTDGAAAGGGAGAAADAGAALEGRAAVRLHRAAGEGGRRQGALPPEQEPAADPAGGDGVVAGRREAARGRRHARGGRQSYVVRMRRVRNDWPFRSDRGWWSIGRPRGLEPLTPAARSARSGGVVRPARSRSAGRGAVRGAAGMGPLRCEGEGLGVTEVSSRVLGVGRTVPGTVRRCPGPHPYPSVPLESRDRTLGRVCQVGAAKDTCCGASVAGMKSRAGPTKSFQYWARFEVCRACAGALGRGWEGSFFLEAVGGEAEGAAVLGDGADEVVRGAVRDGGVDFEGDLDVGAEEAGDVLDDDLGDVAGLAGDHGRDEGRGAVEAAGLRTSRRENADRRRRPLTPAQAFERDRDGAVGTRSNERIDALKWGANAMGYLRVALVMRSEPSIGDKVDCVWKSAVPRGVWCFGR